MNRVAKGPKTTAVVLRRPKAATTTTKTVVEASGMWDRNLEKDRGASRRGAAGAIRSLRNGRRTQTPVVAPRRVSAPRNRSRRAPRRALEAATRPLPRPQPASFRPDHCTRTDHPAELRVLPGFRRCSSCLLAGSVDFAPLTLAIRCLSISTALFKQAKVHPAPILRLLQYPQLSSNRSPCLYRTTRLR